MSFICGDCKEEHPVPTPEEDLEGSPCFDAVLRDRRRLQLQNGALIDAMHGILLGLNTVPSDSPSGPLAMSLSGIVRHGLKKAGVVSE
jgi:hypothetical protein